MTAQSAAHERMNGRVASTRGERRAGTFVLSVCSVPPLNFLMRQ
jgi:hypothetical protein